MTILDKLMAGSMSVLGAALAAVAGREAVQQITAAAWSWRHSIEQFLPSF